MRKFDETICDTLQNQVDNRLIMRADRLWSFRFLIFFKGEFFSEALLNIK